MVRISGPDAIAVGRRVFECYPPLGKRSRCVQFGSLLSAEGVPIDRGLGWVLRGPGSYTGEDTVEITGHGSDAVLRTVLDAALRTGAVLAAPGEFTRRAFLNGRLDLVQAEAVVELIQAGNRHGVDNAYGQVSGQLSKSVRRLKSHVIRALSILELGLDFSHEEASTAGQAEAQHEIQGAVGLCTELIDSFEGASSRQRGRVIALVGRPNVGKSTLLNALLGEERAIVTPIPGTTRDPVEGDVSWRGEWVRLVDTAGLRSGAEGVEREGVRRARKVAAEAEVVVLVLDGTKPWSDADEVNLGLLKGQAGVVAINKSDLPRSLRVPASCDQAGENVDISALHGEGLECLKTRCLACLPQVSLVEGVGLIRSRHRDLLARARQVAIHAQGLHVEGGQDECVVVELQESLRLLGEVLGEGVDDAVLDRIFSEFCIGK